MNTNILRRNDAIDVNGNTLNGQIADIGITVRGSDFLFAVCAIMGLTSLVIFGLSFLKPRSERIFFYITAALNATACIAYFTMGSNLGWAPIEVEFARSDPVVRGVYREIFYTRYIDWVITTPLLLMDLLLTAALPWPSILWVIFLDEVMIITGLIGALVSTRYKFGFYAIGCIAMIAVFWELAYTGRKHAKALGADVHRVYLTCGVLTLFIWLLYPIAWGVSEGGNLIAPDSEAVFYGILDLCAKPVFSAALIAGHWKISPARLGLRIRDSGESYESHAENEKHARRHNSNSSHTATTAPDVGAPAGTATGHSAHTAGQAPAHEAATFEGAPHTITQRYVAGQQTV